MGGSYSLTIFLTIFLFIRAVYCAETRQPRVTVLNGVLVGKYRTSHSGQLYQSFEGIPYAKPPTDDRRFREAEPLRGKWIGEWNATEPGSPCLQYDHFTRHRDENGDWVFSVVGDEDCLYLNVYTKEGSTNKDVVFLIHGGGFMFGNGHIYGPDYIIDMNDIVVVTTNYRLGPLGFLTTGDSVCPGNNGLKDQTLALEWVQKNIAAFGGDPNKVTIVGLSAGGASVHYHYLSELSHGLFQRGYSFSGSTLCPWAFVRDGIEKTKQLASNLGCPITDSKTIVKCLRRRPARQIVEQVKHFHNWVYSPFNVFGPVMEIDSSRSFIDDEPRNLLRQGKVQDLPWITSFTTEDGLYPAGDFVEDDRLLKQLDQNWDSIAPGLLFYKNRSGSKNPVSKVVRQHYLGNKAISSKTVNELLKMMSDRLFIAPAVESALLQAQSNTQPVYLYSYEYEGSLSTSQFHSQTNTSFGVSHGDDFAYIIKFCDRDTHKTDADKKMARFLYNIIEKYIKTGPLNDGGLPGEDAPCTGRLVVENVDKIPKIIEVGRHIGSPNIVLELRINHKIVLRSPPESLKWERVSPELQPKINFLRIISASEVKMNIDDKVGNVKYLREVLDGVTPKKDEL